MNSINIESQMGTAGWREYAPWSDSPAIFGFATALARAEDWAARKGGEIAVSSQDDIQGAITRFTLKVGEREIASRVAYNY